MKKNDQLVGCNIKPKDSTDKKSIAFVNSLIRMTENNTLHWKEMDVNKYLFLSNSVRDKIKTLRKNVPVSSLETAASILADYEKSISTAVRTKEKNVFYVNSSNNVMIFFIREIDYSFAFPITEYSLELISDNDDPSKCYIHETEFSNPNIMKENLMKLSRVILPNALDNSISELANDFIDDVINGKVNFNK